MKTNSGLVKYCIAQLGKPYWMGTFGQTATMNLLYYNRERLPQYYTAGDFPDQIGQRVHDCVGLIKGFLWSESPDGAPEYCSSSCRIDHSADSLLSACKDKGYISSFPNIAGVLVFYKGHVGVYIGDGEVIEARGHSYGVVKTKLKDRPWTNWAKCPYIKYESEIEEMTGEEIYNSLMEYLKNKPASPYAKSSCEKAVLSGLFIDGDGDNSIDCPQAFLTREQAAVLFDRSGNIK